MSVVNNGPINVSGLGWDQVPIICIIKSASTWYSSMVYTHWVSVFGGFPCRLPVVWWVVSIHETYRSFVGCSYTAICYEPIKQSIQSNPIDQLLALWKSEVSHSSCCLFSACSRHFSSTAFGPFRRNVSVGFYRTWLTAVLCDHQNPGPVGRNFLRFRRFHTFFRWCETVAILQRPCVPLDLSPLHLPNGRGWTKLFQLQICKGRATDKQILNRLRVVRCKHQVTKHDFFHELILRICRCFMPSMPCPISSFESCFRSFFVWPSVATLQETMLPSFAKEPIPKNVTRRKNKIWMFAQICCCPSWFSSCILSLLSAWYSKDFILRTSNFTLKKTCCFFWELGLAHWKNTRYNHRSSQLHRVASFFTWFSWDLILFGFGFLVLVFFGQEWVLTKRFCGENCWRNHIVSLMHHSILS